MYFSAYGYTLLRREDVSLEDVFTLARDIDLRGLDWLAREDVDSGELRRCCDNEGLPISSYIFFASGLARDEERDVALEMVKQHVEEAVILGAPALMIPPFGDERSVDDCRDAWIAGLAPAVDIAVDANLVLTIETAPGERCPFVSADDFLMAQRQIPRLGLTLDTGNASMGASAVECAQRCAEAIHLVHCKDYQRSQEDRPGYHRMRDGAWYRCCETGTGIVDFPALLAALQAADYQGPINIEYDVDELPALEATRRGISYLRSIL